MQFIGPLSVVDAELADHAEAVVREGVSNAVRHSNATALKVTVSVEDELSVKVVDDGHGLPAAIAGSGVINLRLRAEQVGGTFSIESPTTGRTVLT